jgi:uroporphyrinogen-III synthase
VPALAAQRQIDAIAFTSSSTVTCFLQRFTAEGGRRSDLEGVAVACIGDKTAATARAGGLAVAVVPAASTLAGLVAALAAHFEQAGQPARVQEQKA